MAKAEATRLDILKKAFELVYQKGYQSTSIDDILKLTQVTKGAFFYHFKNKEEMGLAVIDEIMYPSMIPLLGPSLNKTADIRVKLYDMVKGLLNNEFFKIEYGCPVVNLIDEMAPLNTNFHQALLRVIKLWQKEIESAVQSAIDNGQLMETNNPRTIAMYVISNYAGTRNIAKLFGRSAYTSFLKEFKIYLSDLK